MWIVILILYLSPGISIEITEDLTQEECEDLAFKTGGYCFKE